MLTIQLSFLLIFLFPTLYHPKELGLRKAGTISLDKSSKTEQARDRRFSVSTSEANTIGANRKINIS